MKWTEDEINFLHVQAGEMPIKEMAKQLGRTERAVNIQLHRLNIDIQRGGKLRQRVANNLLVELISLRINPHYFKPTRDFFDHTGIGQKRFYQLFRGEKNITPAEYMAVAKELNVSLQEAFDARQLELNFE